MYQNIKAEIARNDLNYKKVAAELDVSVNTLKNWMAGRTQIPCSKIISMSKMFGCTTDYLLSNQTREHDGDAQ